jgi:GGDEF domain-containing protein
LDGFKPINDHFGRGVGDQILAAVAVRLREQVRAVYKDFQKAVAE